MNPAAIHLLEANLDKINSKPFRWINLSENPAAIHLLEANMNEIDWHQLSANSAAIYLLEANPVCYANDSLPRFLRNRRRSHSRGSKGDGIPFIRIKLIGEDYLRIHQPFIYLKQI